MSTDNTTLQNQALATARVILAGFHHAERGNEAFVQEIAAIMLRDFGPHFERRPNPYAEELQQIAEAIGMPLAPGRTVVQRVCEMAAYARRCAFFESLANKSAHAPNRPTEQPTNT